MCPQQRLELQEPPLQHPAMGTALERCFWCQAVGFPFFFSSIPVLPGLRAAAFGGGGGSWWGLPALGDALAPRQEGQAAAPPGSASSFSALEKGFDVRGVRCGGCPHRAVTR